MSVKSCYVAGGAVGFEKNWDAKFKRTSRTILSKTRCKTHLIPYIPLDIHIYIYGIFTCICHENQPNLGIPCMAGMGMSNFAKNL